MTLNLFKNIFKFAATLVFLLLASPLLIVLFIFRKFSQTKAINSRNIRLANGFDSLEPVQIGGIKQWISIRGEKKENPLLLVLPGGPGASMMPYAFILEPLETFFTIVQWDQRGVGKTYGTNKKTMQPDSITIQQMQADTLEITQYLCTRFKQEKIFILGHSWGSFLGLTLAHEHPELVRAYIGMGQFIHMKENESVGFENILKIAQEKNKQQAIKALKKLDLTTNLTRKDIFTLRKWQFKLNGFTLGKSVLFSIFMRALLAPEYMLRDYFHLVRGMLFFSKSENLFNEIINIDLKDKTNFSTPIFIFAGRKDPLTPSSLVHKHFENITAPQKEFIWFENSGHNVFFEETDKFLECMNALRK